MEEEEEEGGKGKPRSAEADAHTHTHAQVIPPSSLLTRCSTCIPTRREERERERNEGRKGKENLEKSPTDGRTALAHSLLPSRGEREGEREATEHRKALEEGLRRSRRE